MRGPIHHTANLLLILDEFIVVHHLLEFLLVHKVEVFHILFNLALISCSVRFLFLKQIAVFVKSFFDQSMFANTRWSHKNKRLILLRAGIEGLEVLFGVNKYIVLNKVEFICNLRACVGEQLR